MNRIIIFSLLAVVSFFIFHHNSFAVCGGATPFFFCDDNPPNPDPDGIKQASNDADLTVDILPGAEIDTLNGNGGTGVDTGDGNDVVTVTDAMITADNDAIEVRAGNNTVTIIRSNFVGGGDGVDAQFGNDVITITDSTMVMGSSAMFIGSGDDDVTITRSSLTRTSSGRTIALGGGNDTITLNTDAELNSEIDCDTGFDTIIFAMEVPEERLNFFSGQIAQATLPDGSVTIDGLSYSWVDCDLLVNELVGVRNIRPIPTLSEWGLIAMAGIIGLVGLIVVRRRKAVA